MSRILIIFKLFIIVTCLRVSCDVYLRRSEDSEVAICNKFEICNLVHNPTWGVNSVEKLCKCPNGTFCPATFSKIDGKSLSVNVRTQMKFCTSLHELEAELDTCIESGIAIRVKTVYHIDQVKNVSASLLCNCDLDGPTYWRYHSRVGKAVLDDEKLFVITDNFQCAGNLNSLDFMAKLLF